MKKNKFKKGGEEKILGTKSYANINDWYKDAFKIANEKLTQSYFKELPDYKDKTNTKKLKRITYKKKNRENLENFLQYDVPQGTPQKTRKYFLEEFEKVFKPQIDTPKYLAYRSLLNAHNLPSVNYNPEMDLMESYPGHFNPISNSLNIRAQSELIPEVAHSVQNSTGKNILFNWIKEGINKSNYLDSYKDHNSFEYDAHSIIEPKLKEEFLNKLLYYKDELNKYNQEKKQFKGGGSFQDQLRGNNLPQVDNTATPINLPPNLLFDGTKTVNGSSSGLTPYQQKIINERFKKQAELKKQKELADYKLAKQFHDNNPVNKLFTGKSEVTAVPITNRELAAGMGEGIKDFYNIPGIGIANDFINPLQMASSGVIAPWAQAPLQAQQSDSNWPYAGAALSTALTVPMLMGAKGLASSSVEKMFGKSYAVNPTTTPKGLIDYIDKEKTAGYTNGNYGYPTQVSGAGMDVYPNTPNQFLNKDYSSFGNMESGVVNTATRPIRSTDDLINEAFGTTTLSTPTLPTTPFIIGDEFAQPLTNISDAVFLSEPEFARLQQIYRENPSYFSQNNIATSDNAMNDFIQSRTPSDYITNISYREHIGRGENPLTFFQPKGLTKKQTLLDKVRKNISSNLNKVNESIGKLDEKAGSYFNKNKEIETNKFIEDINTELSTGVGIKKSDIPIKVEETYTSKNGKGLRILLDPDKTGKFISSGTIDLVNESGSNKKLTSQIRDFLNSPIANAGKPRPRGLVKVGDFPTQRVGMSTDLPSNINTTGVGGELGETIKRAIKKQDKNADLFSSTSHTEQGATRYLHEYLNGRKKVVDQGWNTRWIKEADKIKAAYPNGISKEELKLLMVENPNLKLPYGAKFKYKKGGEMKNKYEIGGEIENPYVSNLPYLAGSLFTEQLGTSPSLTKGINSLFDGLNYLSQSKLDKERQQEAKRVSQINSQQPYSQNIYQQMYEGGGEIKPKEYLDWKSKLPKNLQYEGDYDLFGLWQSNPNVKPTTDLHFPDTFKLSNHPTFSNESKYYTGKIPGVGGYWNENQYIKNPNIGPSVAPMHFADGGNINGSPDIFTLAGLQDPFSNLGFENPYQTQQETPIETTTPNELEADGDNNPMSTLSYLSTRLAQEGYQPHQIAGVLGNIEVESGGFNSKAYNPDDKGSPAGGLAQFRGTRLDQLKAFSKKLGTDWTNPMTQTEFIINELNTTEKKAKTKLLETTDVESAARVWDKYYERSDGKAIDKRVNAAKKYHNLYQNMNDKLFKTKSSNVNTKNLHPQLTGFLNDISTQFPGLVVSSANDSNHMKGSKHYNNKAADIGANSSDRQAYLALKQALNDPKTKQQVMTQYGIEDIIDEGDHLHVELMKNGGVLNFKGGGQNPAKVYTDRKQFEQAQRMYNDSLNLHNNGLKYYKNINGEDKTGAYKTDNFKNTKELNNYISMIRNIAKVSKPNSEYEPPKWALDNSENVKLFKGLVERAEKVNINPIGQYQISNYSPAFKKPVQPVVYQPQSTSNNTQTPYGKQLLEIPKGKKESDYKIRTYHNPITGNNDFTYVRDQKIKRINPQQMDLNSNVNIQGQQVPFPQFQVPQQKGTPVYGPGNTIIGYSDNMNFKPAYEYTGASNNQFNLQDKALLSNPDALKKYVKKLDNYKFSKEELKNGGKMKNKYMYKNGGMSQSIFENGQANAEIEGKENVFLPNGVNFKAVGDSHAKGGIDVKLPENTFIFSENLKAPKDITAEMLGKEVKDLTKAEKKFSFSDIAEKFNTEKEFKVMNEDKFKKQSANLNLEHKINMLETLKIKQELHKAKTGIDNDLENVTQTSKFARGGMLDYNKPQGYDPFKDPWIEDYMPTYQDPELNQMMDSTGTYDQIRSQWNNLLTQHKANPKKIPADLLYTYRQDMIRTMEGGQENGLIAENKTNIKNISSLQNQMAKEYPVDMTIPQSNPNLNQKGITPAGNTFKEQVININAGRNGMTEMAPGTSKFFPQDEITQGNTQSTGNSNPNTNLARDTDGWNTIDMTKLHNVNSANLGMSLLSKMPNVRYPVMNPQMQAPNYLRGLDLPSINNANVERQLGIGISQINNSNLSQIEKMSLINDLTAKASEQANNFDVTKNVTDVINQNTQISNSFNAVDYGNRNMMLDKYRQQQNAVAAGKQQNVNSMLADIMNFNVNKAQEDMSTPLAIAQSGMDTYVDENGNIKYRPNRSNARLTEQLIALQAMMAGYNSQPNKKS